VTGLRFYQLFVFQTRHRK